MRKILALTVFLAFFTVSAVAQPVNTRPSKYYGTVEFESGGSVESGTVIAYAENREQGRTEFTGGDYELVVERNNSSEDYSSVSFGVILDGSEIPTGQSAKFRAFGSQQVNLTIPRPESGTTQGQQDTGGSGGGGGSFSGAGFTTTDSGNTEPVAGFTWDTPVRPGEEVVLSALGSFDADGNITRYRWSIGATGPQAQTVFDSPGSYPVTLTVEDGSEATTNVTKEVIVTKNKPPVPSFDIIYTGSNILTDVEFNASGSYDPDGGITRYSWSFGAQGETAVSSFQQSRNVTLTVVDNEGKVSSVTKQLNEPVEQEDSSPSAQGGSLTGKFTASQTGAVITLALIFLAVGFLLIRRSSISVKVLRSNEG